MIPTRRSAHVFVTALLCGLLPLSATAHAATPEQAKAFSERASAHIKQVGEEKAFIDFSRRDGGFIDGELHVFCLDRNGINRAHGGNSALVGRNLLRMKDPNGLEPYGLVASMGFEQGQGWVDSKWPNPATKRIERASAYVIRTNGVVCAVPYYKG